MSKIQVRTSMRYNGFESDHVVEVVIDGVIFETAANHAEHARQLVERVARALNIVPDDERVPTSVVVECTCPEPRKLSDWHGRVGLVVGDPTCPVHFVCKP